MTDSNPLRCTKCGMTAGYADAFEADCYKTCGGDSIAHEVVSESGYVRYSYGPGETHDWIDQ